MTSRIFHITQSNLTLEAKRLGRYQPPTFEQEGFVHCSFLHQVIPVCNRLFAGQSDLVLLEVDVARVDGRIVLENLEGGDEQYPHLYDCIPWNAVSSVHPLRESFESGFQLPDSIQR